MKRMSFSSSRINEREKLVLDWVALRDGSIYTESRAPEIYDPSDTRQPKQDYS